MSLSCDFFTIGYVFFSDLCDTIMINISKLYQKGFMLKEKDSSAALEIFFKKNKLGTLTDLFPLLKTKSRMSVFRRLRELQYLSSYTHAGSYYTLHNIPDFDSSGLWYFKEVGFSKFGTLKESVLHFIEQSESGQTHGELERKLHVLVYNTLLDLVNSKKITRTKIDGDYVYFSIRPSKSAQQILQRKNYSHRLKHVGLSDWIIIEILASIIRVTKGVCIESSNIISDLSSRDIIVIDDQVDYVLRKFDLKKTQDYP